MGIEKRVFEALKWPLKLIFCAKLSAFCKESNGDSEDARRPLKHLQTTVKNLQSHLRLYVYTCGAH
eukprot:12134563-Heterocapsa_arctica.AAC.1